MKLIANPYRVRESDVYDRTLAAKVQLIRQHRRYSLLAAIMVMFAGIVVPVEIGFPVIVFMIGLIAVAVWHFLLIAGENSARAYGKIFPELVDQRHSS